MPIFQDDHELPAYGRAAKKIETSIHIPTLQQPEINMRRTSEESIRTELCEGPIAEESAMDWRPTDTSPTSDRAELMERLKRGESPTWAPHRRLELLLQDQENCSARFPSSDASGPCPSSPAAAEPQQESRKLSTVEIMNSHISDEPERPRSAVQFGDFTQRGGSENAIKDTIDKSYLPTPWMPTSPPRDFSFHHDSRFPSASHPEGPYERPSRFPFVSSSLSRSFQLMAPTSPLVQSESNEDLDYGSPMDGIEIGAGTQKLERRHTLHASGSIPSLRPAFNFSRPLPNLRRDNAQPYQAHQPRRSLASTSSFHDDTALPYSPPRSRRISHASESSPLQHASMVGSYEESILRGRMSTTPSNSTIEFIADIGVVGKGERCPANLRCPDHVQVSFRPVYYSYGTTTHGRTINQDDGPSPYVGLIDIENGIKAETERRGGARSRRTGSLKAPPGGSYRIPKEGRLQVMIKDSYNTAGMVFGVPYNLKGMTPGTKTFIRQREYATIDDPTFMKTFPTQKVPQVKGTLRYLIHLHICCPSKSRYYLYKSIRVVFAHRKYESLIHELQNPVPRYAPWKPTLESVGSTIDAVGAGATLAADKAFRRRSSGFPLSNATNSGKSPFEAVSPKTVNSRGKQIMMEEVSSTFSDGSGKIPISPIPFGFNFKRNQVPNIPSKYSQISTERSAMMSENETISPGSGASSNTNSRPNSADLDDKQEYRRKSNPLFEELDPDDIIGYAQNLCASRQQLAAQNLKKLELKDGAEYYEISESLKKSPKDLKCMKLQRGDVGNDDYDDDSYCGSDYDWMSRRYGLARYDEHGRRY